MQYEGATESVRSGRVLIFCLFGGLVALVFQLADMTDLIPIQAFVLGATWPSVVTRVMAGSAGDDPRAGPASSSGPARHQDPSSTPSPHLPAMDPPTSHAAGADPAAQQPKPTSQGKFSGEIEVDSTP